MEHKEETSIYRTDKDVEHFLNEQIEIAKTKIRGRAIIATSGGVDSTVAAYIIKEAIGSDLQGIFVDNGFMRKNEPEEVEEMLNKCGISSKFIDAVDDFQNATLEINEKIPEEYRDYDLPLKVTATPEVKRWIIGQKFIRVFEKEAREIDAKYLVQGTIAPDWIESGGGLRDTIKSHHNVGGLPEDMEVELIEPLRNLYKSDVYRIVKYLDLPVKRRQPFPGPGLAIRVVGKPNKENVEVAREASHIVEDEIDRAVANGEMKQPWQYYGGYAPDWKTVCVQGDLRRYLGTAIVRAVHSQDAMTAYAAEIPYDVQGRIASRITNSMPSLVGRVFFDRTNKPPGTVELE